MASFDARVLERHAGKHFRQKHVARDLLRDGARAGGVGAFAAQVGNHGADDPDRIDARMIVEAAVLDGQDGLDHARRNGRQRHGPALLAVADVE
jgi:hypothetical protein